MGSNLYHFTCWLSHTSTSAISSQKYMSHNHTNQNPRPPDLYLCHGRLWQSPKVTEGMAAAVGSCWWLLLLMATCGIEGHAGHSASVAPAAGDILLLHPTLRRQHMGQTQPWIRTFPLHLARVLCYSSCCLPQHTVPDHLPFIPHSLFHYWPVGWNELHISSWKHRYLRTAWRKKITQIIGTTAPQ